ncbi:MAG TPA: hypothetical protein PLU53_03565 [Bacteroidia bacterium]|nr:hypothetical protein [Bacteroidia bacterium]
MRKYKLFRYFIVALLWFPGQVFAQDQEARISLRFEKGDSINICKALVTANDTPVKDVEVKLYVKRLFSLLPVGDATATDEEGVASFEFPGDIPADLDGKLTIFAKIEDDENFGNVEASGKADWGVPRTDSQKMERSLSGSRSNAPWVFIIVSNIIIIGIWGTLIYVIMQLFKIRKLSRHLAKK